MYYSVTDYLLETANKYPNKIAFKDINKSITFSELVDSAKRIGTYIVNSISVKKPIVVYMDKKADNISAFMGIAFANCFYTPIDNHMPLDRVELILHTLNPEIIIYDDTTKDNLDKLNSDAKVISFDEIVKSNMDEKLLNDVRNQMKQTDLLYVLFTSGSTGIPKGVTISHLAVIDFMEWICEKYNLDENTSLCNQAPFYFDASMPDIYIPLKTGASVYIPPKSYYTFPKKVLEFVEQNNINTLIWVPSALCNAVNCRALEIYAPQCIRLVIFCGEVMPCKHLNVWKKYVPNALYVNMYGPTEAAYACTYFDIIRDFFDEDKLPLGKACENSTILLITDENKIAEINEPGEICILGQCLSNGYYNNKEKTEAAFVQNPVNTLWEEKMYRTGDLAYLDENNELIFMGRKDFQIKRLGHRIELGEIENAILAIEGINNACCVFNEDNSDIIAIYSGNNNEQEIERTLENILPKYMLPNRFIKLASLPMNMNGKIDRPLLKEKYTKE